MKKANLFLVAAFLIGIALLLAGCAAQQTPAATPVPTTVTTAPATPPPMTTVATTPPAITTTVVQTTFVPPISVTVTIQNYTFIPDSVTVPAGSTVYWTNLDPAAHQVLSDTHAFMGNPMSRNTSYSFTFNNRGTFPYHCAIHPTMKGTVTVT
jgi:plastocyanin